MLTTFAPMIWGNWHLDWGQSTHIMGILNVTPDSFAGDGILRTELEPSDVSTRALEQARAFSAEGARLVDVGGESTRPGFAALALKEEIRRVIPVIRHLATHLSPQVIISIDTYKAEVARQALEAGASMVND